MKKILIIVGGLQYGGIQRFVVNIIKNAKKEEFSFDYLIFNGFGTDFVPEVEECGGKIIIIDPPSAGYRRYIDQLGKILDHTHYDVVHSHTQFNSGINLWVAKKHHVPLRISHSHTTAHENQISFIQKVYERSMRSLIRHTATSYLACGIQAGRWMYGNHRFQIITNGIDTGRFVYSVENRNKIRKKYGIKPDDFIFIHSGTLSVLKNQEFLIRIVPEISRTCPSTKLMLLGTGEENQIKHLHEVADEIGVSDQVIFVGATMDVHEYLSAADVYAFPSLREGTPLAVIEAQANGLPCILSDAIPGDAGITDLVTQISLEDKEVWIKAICENRRKNPEIYACKVKEAGFDARDSYEKLYDIYRR